MSLVPVELSNLQANLDLPEAERVASTVLTQDESPQATSKSMIRSAILAGAGVGGAGLMLIALIDSLLLGRRSPDPAGATEDDEAAAGPARPPTTTVRVTRRTRTRTPPRPTPLRPVAAARPEPAPSGRALVTTRLVRRRRRGAERDEAS